MLTEGRFKELRKANEHNGQMLAKVESKFQSFPRDHFAPAAPLATHRGPKVLRDPQCYEPTLGAGGSGVEETKTKTQKCKGISGQFGLTGIAEKDI